MAFEELQPLSIEEITSGIRSLECQYGLESSEFEGGDERALLVPEDDAIEWKFLLLQKAAIDAAMSTPRYAGRSSCLRAEDVNEPEAQYHLAA